jgi:hypothetical protein
MTTPEASQPQPEVLSPKVKAYLDQATLKLLKGGVIDALKSHAKFTRDVIADSYLGDGSTPEDIENGRYHEGNTLRFLAAELPLAAFSALEDEETDLAVVKVDDRGHVFEAYTVDLDPELSPKETIILARELYKEQKELGWQPIYDIADLPK